MNYKSPKRAWEGLPKDKSLFTTKTGYGLPIGNLTSQVFANFYLTEFDQFLKEELGLTLHPKKIYLQPAKIGVPFLGAYIKPNYIMAGKRVLKNFPNTIELKNRQ